jgi:ferredoxin
VGNSILAFRRDNKEDILSSKGFQEQYPSSQAGHDGACSWNPLCINCAACVIVCPVEAIFNKADLPEWGRRPQVGIDTRGTGIGSAGVCLFPEQAAAGSLRRHAKEERTLVVGGRESTAEVHEHASPQGRGGDGGKGGSR